MIGALSFLTVLGAARTPDERTFRWFPVVGALIGGLLGAVWWGLSEITSPGVAAAVVIAVDLALTGLLHVDGLADSADGLLPHLDRERRLEVMRAPDVGAFALAVVPAVLLLRWTALASQPVEPLVLVGVWSMSRTIAAVVPAAVPYARADGLAAPFLAGAHPRVALGLVPATAVLVVVDPLIGSLAAIGAVATALAVVALARRRLGGFTGDVLGAVIVLVETVGLLVFALELS
ncbi:MAG: adenosylcobinamide-GDP ribazoletransferase [Actinomycetota bacterium]